MPLPHRQRSLFPDLLRFALVALFSVSVTYAGFATEFEDNIIPLLDKYCYRCHGEDEQIAQPYIVAVTADLINSGRKRCIENGMDDHLSKPISEDKLNRVLTDFLKAKS